MNKEIDNRSFGDAKTVSSSPINEDVKPKEREEERCFFGLLSLRSGVLVTCAGSFMIDLLFLFYDAPNSYGEDSIRRYGGEPFFDRFNVIIPFTGGIRLFQVSSVYCISPVGIYGAYYKSPRAMKYYKRMFLIESFCTNFQCLTNFVVALYNNHKWLNTTEIIEAMSPEELSFERTMHKVTFLLFTTVSCFMIATDRYSIRLHNRYYRSLKENEQE